ncbi:MAG: CAP domain-containing protein [Balneolales bacterium]|nr:CAP domain-containing protein [Balneolales bacterium]
MSTSDLLVHLEANDVRAQDEFGYTALMHAADFTSDATVIALLIKLGSVINQTDNEGFTALMWAAANNKNPDVTRALIISGADITYQDSQGRTAMDWASESGAPDEVISILKNSHQSTPAPSHNRHNKEKQFRYASQTDMDAPPPPKRTPVGPQHGAPGTETDSPTTETTTETTTEISAFSGDFAKVEEIIFELVNHYRSEEGVPPILIDANLAAVARDHSRDMVVRNFFSHQNPDNLSANQRINETLGDTYYINSSGENILYTGIQSDYENEPEILARQIMRQWMNSPGHRSNILSPYGFIGIGLYPGDNVVYATQKFMSYMVRLDGQKAGDTLVKNSPYVHFIISPTVPDLSNVVVSVKLPDSSARCRSASGGFYTGVCFPTPQWSDEEKFSILLPVEEFGTGQYSLSIGTAGGTNTFIRSIYFQVE